MVKKELEVAVGLEPTKAGFADQRLDRFGIATLENLYPQSIPKTAPKPPSYRVFAPLLALPNLLKPRTTSGDARVLQTFPYHLATAPSSSIPPSGESLFQKPSPSPQPKENPSLRTEAARRAYRPAPPAARAAAICWFTIGAPIKLPHSVHDPS